MFNQYICPTERTNTDDTNVFYQLTSVEVIQEAVNKESINILLID